MIDSHAHVAFEGFDKDREAVIARAREAGVSWIEIGTDVEQSKKALQLGVPTAVGIHPSDIASVTTSDVVTGIVELVDNPNVVAIGEVGIDLFHSQNLSEQVEALRRFINLAREKDLPVVFHVRSAHEEMIKFLREENWNRGVIHTFSGTRSQAKEYLDLGLYLSFSGVVTFKNAGEILDVAKTMPLEKMLIETDCPFLAPEPFRGKRNEPAYVKYVAQKIAEVRGISFDEVAQITEDNAKQLFGL